MRQQEHRGRSGMIATVLTAVIAVTVMASVLTAAAPASAATLSPTPTPTASPAAPVAKPVVSPRPSASATPGAKPVATPKTPPTPTPTPTPTPVPRPVGPALTAAILGTPVLTLPAKDGLRDATSVRIRSGAAGAVDLLAVAGKRIVELADATPLKRTAAGWSRTVIVPVGALPAGSWSIRARRTADHAVRARTPEPLLVGTGRPVHVFVRPSARTLYPYADGVLDTVTSAVQATDETGAALPVTGTLRVDAGTRHRSAPLSTLGTAALDITGLPLGTAVLTAAVKAPGGAGTRTTPVTFAPTAVGTATVVRSSDTVQPVADGLLDAVTLTTSGSAVAGSLAPVSGTLTVTLGTTVVQRWTVPNGVAHTYTWNGRTGGVIVPGTYAATLSLRGPEGAVKTTTKPLLVTKQHLPYRMIDLFSVAAGNQQGLAVHDGTFYVGYDNGDGTARIEKYDGSGALTGTLGPLAIGHAAELSYSTTTGMLYAANGGASDMTTVWAIDPATGAITRTMDLSALGPNGMVAVDDANSRLLVFAGSAGSYAVSAVGLTDTTAADGSTVPAGTVLATARIASTGTSPGFITGVPQGIEVVGSQLWLYTSLRNRNHLAKYDLQSDALVAESDLMSPGEGEGLGFDASDTGARVGWIYVGAHDANRVGELQPVADE